MESLKHKEKVVGIKQTRNAVLQSRAQIVFVADDADFQATQPLKELCAQTGVECVDVPARKELAKACGVDVPTAAAAILKD